MFEGIHFYTDNVCNGIVLEENTLVGQVNDSYDTRNSLQHLSTDFILTFPISLLIALSPASKKGLGYGKDWHEQNKGSRHLCPRYGQPPITVGPASGADSTPKNNGKDVM